MKKIVKKDGITGLYRGFCASLVGIFFYRGLYFGLYDSGKYFLFGEKESSIYLRLLFAPEENLILLYFILYKFIL